MRANMDAMTRLQCIASLVLLMPLAVHHYESMPGTAVTACTFNGTERLFTTGLFQLVPNTLASVARALSFDNILYIGVGTKPRITRMQRLAFHGQLDCDTSFQDQSLHHLKLLLGSHIFKNIAINCTVNQTLQLLTALHSADHVISILEVPRINLLLFDNVAQYYYKYGWERMSLIQTIVSVKELQKQGDVQQVSSCGHCCIRSSVTVHSPRIRTSTRAGTLSASCQYELKHTYSLKPTDALRGVHLTIATAKYFPFTTLYTLDNVLHHRGYCAEVLQSLEDHLNFTYTLVDTVDGSWGSKDETTGKWNGMIGMVVRKEADMIMAGMTISKTRSEAVDFTYPFWEEPSAFVVKPWERKETYFYKTFRWEVWLSIFSCLITTTLVIWMFEVRHLWVSNNITKESILLSLVNVYFGTLSTMVMKDFLPIVQGRAARVLWMGFWLVSLVMTTTYTGNLVAAMSTKTLKLPFKTLEELAADTMYTVTVSDSSVQMALMEEAKEGVFARLWTRVAQSEHNRIKDPDWEEHLYRLINGTEPLTYTGDKSSIEQLLYQVKRCDWMTIPEEYLPSGFGIALPKGSPFERLISSELMSLEQFGLFKRWRNLHFLKSQCGAMDRYGTESISASHIVIVLYVMCGFLALSFIVFCIEFIAPNINVVKTRS